MHRGWSSSGIVIQKRPRVGIPDSCFVTRVSNLARRFIILEDRYEGIEAMDPADVHFTISNTYWTTAKIYLILLQHDLIPRVERLKKMITPEVVPIYFDIYIYTVSLYAMGIVSGNKKQFWELQSVVYCFEIRDITNTNKLHTDFQA